MFLLQISDSNGVQTLITNPVSVAESTSDSSYNLIDLLLQGGVIMIPLGIILISAIWVFFDRLFVIRTALILDDRFMLAIKDYIVSANLLQAKAYAKSMNGPVYRVIEKGLMRIGKPIDIIQSSMENAGKLEMYKLEKNLPLLSSIAGMAPMFGFLGTIIGMIKLFYNISYSGEYTLNTIAGGIYTKMMTSASGLIIGLFAYMACNYFNSLIDKIAFKIHETSTDFLDLLQDPISKN